MDYHNAPPPTTLEHAMEYLSHMRDEIAGLKRERDDLDAGNDRLDAENDRLATALSERIDPCGDVSDIAYALAHSVPVGETWRQRRAELIAALGGAP